MLDAVPYERLPHRRAGIDRWISPCLLLDRGQDRRGSEAQFHFASARVPRVRLCEGIDRGVYSADYTEAATLAGTGDLGDDFCHGCC